MSKMRFPIVSMEINAVDEALGAKGIRLAQGVELYRGSPKNWFFECQELLF